jgi:hypothetical protein
MKLEEVKEKLTREDFYTLWSYYASLCTAIFFYIEKHNKIRPKSFLLLHKNLLKSDLK